MSTRDKASLIKQLEDYRLRNKEQSGAGQALPDTLMMAWIFHDNQLEGRSLNPDEIKVAIYHRDQERPSYLRPLFEDIRVYRDAINLAWTWGQRGPEELTLTRLKELHKHLMQYTPQEGAKQRLNSPVHRDYHQAICPHTAVQRLLQELYREVQSFDPDTQEVLSYAASLHHKLMYVYPFRRMPGALARLFTNQFLVSHGYPPIVIPAHERGAYYDALAAPDHQALTQIFHQAMWRILDILPQFEEAQRHVHRAHSAG